MDRFDSADLLECESSPSPAIAVIEHRQATHLTGQNDQSEVRNSLSKAPPVSIRRPSTDSDSREDEFDTKFKQPRQCPDIRTFFTAWWRWEILAMLLSITCEAAIIIVLICMDGKPLSRWKSAVSLNATIAVFSTIAKSAMLVPVAECISQLKWLHLEKQRKLKDLDVFDKSSRGPLGSMDFLRAVGYKSPLASLGAVIVFIALAIDPITQQILSFPIRNVEIDNGKASFLNANSYISAREFSSCDKDLTMGGAILSAIYGSVPAPASICQTANCTWPGTYLSLGVESHCADVTRQTYQNCTVMGRGNDINKDSNTVRCDLQTPSGAIFQTSYVVYNMTSNKDGYLSGENITSEWTREAGYNMWYPLGLLNASISSKPAPANSFSNISFYTTHWTSDWEGNDQGTVTVVEKVVDCRLDLVAHKYSKVNTTLGILNLGTPDVLPLKDTEFDTYYSRGGETYYNLEVVDPSLVPVNFSAKFNISDYLKFSSGEFLYNFIRPGVPMFLDLVLDISSISPIQQKIYNSDIKDMMATIARAMTETIRTGPNSTAAIGLENVREVFIQVSWGWIVLPVVVILAALVLLAMSIWLAHKRQSILWKSSSLALLLHKLVPRDADSGSIRSKEELEQFARRTDVQCGRPSDLEILVKSSRWNDAES